MTLTTDQLVRDYIRRTRLPRRQTLLLLARCALVRHLADNYYDRFILKGGGLLYHVYGTNRVSLVDTDFADVETHVPDPEEIKGVMTIRAPDGSFELSTTPVGTWTEKGSILAGRRLSFTASDLAVTDERKGRVNVSVSFRRGERIITPDRDLYFDPDGLLVDNTPFKVNGLVLDEVAAEKVLAWCVKDELYKHFADLALLARDHADELDPERVADLVRQKFKEESKAMETRMLYRERGLSAPADLNKYFLEETRLEAMRADWKSQIGVTIWLRPEEAGRPQSIHDPANAEAIIREFWAEMVEGLPA